MYAYLGLMFAHMLSNTSSNAGSYPRSAAMVRAAARICSVSARYSPRACMSSRLCHAPSCLTLDRTIPSWSWDLHAYMYGLIVSLSSLAPGRSE